MQQHKKTIDLFSKDSKNLEDFGRILGKKFIVQRGTYIFKPHKKLSDHVNGASVYRAINLADSNKIVAIKGFSKKNKWSESK